MFAFKPSDLHPRLQLLDARSRGACGVLALAASLATLSATLALSGVPADVPSKPPAMDLRAQTCRLAEPVAAGAPCRCAPAVQAPVSCIRSS